MLIALSSLLGISEPLIKINWVRGSMPQHDKECNRLFIPNLFQLNWHVLKDFFTFVRDIIPEKFRPINNSNENVDIKYLVKTTSTETTDKEGYLYLKISTNVFCHMMCLWDIYIS